MENQLDRDYKTLLAEIIGKGVEKEDRTGTGTVSLFGKEIRHDMKTGFPLLTTKKMAFKTMVTELLWFLKGDTNIKYLVDNGCNIWNGDAYTNYMRNWHGKSLQIGPCTKEEFIEQIKTDKEFANKWGELGPIYGKQWRDWERRTTREEKIVNPGVYTEQIDQIQNLIEQLKTNPDSRRLMVSAWNVGELDQMILPPCHYGFQVYTTEMTEDERRLAWTDRLGKDFSYANRIYNKQLDEFNFPKRKISLMWNQRSVDTFLGLPFNIASYGLLLTIIGKMTNMIPDQLIGRLGDTHLYSNHLSPAKKQIIREEYELPSVSITKDTEFWRRDLDYIVNNLSKDDFHLLGYESHPSIKAPLSN